MAPCERQAASGATIHRVATGTSDDSSSFIADDSEFNALNTDRQLYAVRTVCKAMEKLEQKKSMLYFSGGLTRQGIENQASIRSAGNECVKADTAIYAVDSRGLQALNTVGDPQVTVDLGIVRPQA